MQIYYMAQGSGRQVRVKFKDFQRLLKASPTVCKDLKFIKSTDLKQLKFYFRSARLG